MIMDARQLLRCQEQLISAQLHIEQLQDRVQALEAEARKRRRREYKRFKRQMQNGSRAMTIQEYINATPEEKEDTKEQWQLIDDYATKHDCLLFAGILVLAFRFGAHYISNIMYKYTRDVHLGDETFGNQLCLDFTVNRGESMVGHGLLQVWHHPRLQWNTPTCQAVLSAMPDEVLFLKDNSIDGAKSAVEALVYAGEFMLVFKLFRKGRIKLADLWERRNDMQQMIFIWGCTLLDDDKVLQFLYFFVPLLQTKYGRAIYTTPCFTNEWVAGPDHVFARNSTIAMVLAIVENYEALLWLLRYQAGMEGPTMEARLMCFMLQRVSKNFNAFIMSVLTNKGDFESPCPHFPADMFKLVLAYCGVTRTLHDNRVFRDQMRVRNGKDENLCDILAHLEATRTTRNAPRMIKELLNSQDIMGNPRLLKEALTQTRHLL